MKEKMVIGLVVLLVALSAFAGWPTIVDPHGPDSGTGRTLWGEPASGPGPTTA